MKGLPYGIWGVCDPVFLPPAGLPKRLLPCCGKGIPFPCLRGEGVTLSSSPSETADIVSKKLEAHAFSRRGVGCENEAPPTFLGRPDMTVVMRGFRTEAGSVAISIFDFANTVRSMSKRALKSRCSSDAPVRDGGVVPCAKR